MNEAFGKDSLHYFLNDLVSRLNKYTFALNETSGYFSIQVAGRKRGTNTVCFVKSRPILSINIYCYIEASLLDSPPFNRLKKLSSPPEELQLRIEDRHKYPINLEYNLEKDKDLIFQLCKKACNNFISEMY